ncbi:hypothetical protein L3X38_006930 [Prunus dulcis]|uniref:Uncharacterized protein n=1 Tax=Prunus dulcis TaxID=3755 RepID=A0AAD5F5P6_PRUDU|nr:hypothetical protein L3X38_006930 [Prunus dulcis]
MPKSVTGSNSGRVTVKVGEWSLRFTWVLFPIYREVKVGALHKVPMWDFVQAVVVATRVMDIRFGTWELGLGSVSSFGMGEGVVALVLVALMLRLLGSLWCKQF